jgi:toxin HigB-1
MGRAREGERVDQWHQFRQVVRYHLTFVRHWLTVLCDPVVLKQGLGALLRDWRRPSLQCAERQTHRHILRALDDASRPEDMNLPGFRFHGLVGSDKGRYAVNASGNWRITFGWSDGEATDVDLEDYH